MEIEPLLVQIEGLAPGFGRVSGDLTAIVSRGRAKDFRGVMQNSRLVLEAILRDLVTRELKQTPGKAMLDELISKFRQQANAGTVPTNMLAHMGTVQAWGNLSSHDQAGALSDQGVQVGEQEVATSLNSMVAILNWYAAKTGVDGTFVRPPTQAPVVKKSRIPMVAGLMGAAVVGVGGYFIASRPPSSDAKDVLFRTRGEPLPPQGCRDNGAEDHYLKAREEYEAGGLPGIELERALACPGFAAALSLSGKLAVRQADAVLKQGEKERAAALLNKAATEFDAALTYAPTFKNARFNRAVVVMKQGHVDEGIRDLTELVAADPGFAEAHFFLALGLEQQGDKVRAKSEYCAASKNGYKLAQSRCEAGD